MFFLLKKKSHSLGLFSSEGVILIDIEWHFHSKSLRGRICAREYRSGAQSMVLCNRSKEGKDEYMVMLDGAHI